MKKISDLNGKTYFTCSACMGVLADALSWANAHKNLVTKEINDANNIVVLSCQVTDLAILSDFRLVERLRDEHPSKKIFISGCLSARLDIDLPDRVERLEQMRTNYQSITDKTLVYWEKPFWVPDFNEVGSPLDIGHIFRDTYPLRIGKGCQFNCDYCTIRLTRGKHEEYDIDNRLIKEFLGNENVTLIADSPTAKQIKAWCNLAIQKNKSISIRNVEPQIVMKCMHELLLAAQKGVLNIFHSPIQHTNADVLRDMKRGVRATFTCIDFVRLLKHYGVKIATSIIINYKMFDDDFSQIHSLYDYISWNPLWRGKFDRQLAEQRFEYFINGNYDPFVDWKLERKT